MNEDDINRTERIFCPRCGAPTYFAKQYTIDWDEQEKEFLVYLAFYCSPCRYFWESELIKRLPLIIAQESICSCGAKLSLLKYNLKKRESEIEFEGIYKCNQCAKKERTLVENLKQGLLNIWEKTMKVEVGPTGIKYEKKAST